MAPTPTRTSSRRASAGAKRKNYAEDEDHGDETAASPTRKSARTRTVKSKASKKEYDSDNLDEDEDEKVKVVKNNPARKRRRVEEEEESEEEKEEGVKEGKVKALARSPRKASSRKKAKPTYDSDALDEESAQEEDKSEYDGEEDGEAKPKSKSKRTPKATKSKYFSPRKKASSSKAKDEGDDEEFDDVDLKEGQEVVGTVVQAPTTGRVPPGRISQNTLDFLTHLKDPACNDRTWFRLHEPVYRVAEKEWKDFVEKWQEELIEVDPQIPQLPTKDVIHRIYRDIRFSNDKTPYKRGFSATFSRGGRKGIFAKYHIAVKPGDESIIAAGLWCPGRNELANIRTNLQRDSRRFKRIISAPRFVELFGKPEPHPKGGRQSIFGHEDELKVAPKGVDKNHKDIAILKCRTFAVVHTFKDSEVLDPGFQKTLAGVARVMKPFVYILNDLLTVGGGQGGSDSDDDDDEGDGGEGDEGDEGEGDGDASGDQVRDD